ncbi:hypothetical protein [Actinoalloteichus hymeniacidonis]|uniref:Uncharacterized protein n=1 Tax=Actinoalloteichus hymeniacidonis TaxID=340345 RepID=A0AAC9HTQ7_9PSEU|nr:hypothetical protein [Actinoalloteichus hymeniacidonis]AOS65215.1 hypothetical protein TL08_22165 [Actinoalloteichus hymeniacidonis]MBB5906705.1 hypothetical protein [Actinoalloteichus hymeniacidonis]
MSKRRFDGSVPLWWWILVGLLFVTSLLPAAAWLWYGVRVMSDCVGGYDNPGLSGRLEGWWCVLSLDGAVFFRLPAAEVIASGLTASAVAVMTLLVMGAAGRRAARWLALPAIPAMLAIGMVMSRRSLDIATGYVGDWFLLTPDMPALESYALRMQADELLVRTPTVDVLLPEPPGFWRDSALIALALSVAVAIATARLMVGDQQ